MFKLYELSIQCSIIIITKKHHVKKRHFMIDETINIKFSYSKRLNNIPWRFPKQPKWLLLCLLKIVHDEVLPSTFLS